MREKQQKKKKRRTEVKKEAEVKRTELEEGTPNKPTTSDCRKTSTSKAITGDALAMPTAR